MPAPKGHAPYPGSERGGAFGYLGRGDDWYSDELLEELGLGVIEWIQQKGNIWMKTYFILKGMRWETVHRLRARNEKFNEHVEIAKSIQESKLCTEPYYKKADANHARFMLARHHKGDWEDKVESVGSEQEASNLSKSLDTVEFLQSMLSRSMDDKSNNADAKS